MSLLRLKERQVDLRDDWWTNRRNEPLSVLWYVWSKIRSSIKIALWNLSALCQWSGGMFSCWHVSYIQRSLLLSVCLSFTVFLMSFFLSALSIFLLPRHFVLCFESLSVLPFFSEPVSDLPQPCVMFIKVSFVIWCCLFRGGHISTSQQGWLWSSCPEALNHLGVEGERHRGSKRRWSRGEWQTAGGRKWRNEESKMKEKGREAER